MNHQDEDYVIFIMNFNRDRKMSNANIIEYYLMLSNDLNNINLYVIVISQEIGKIDFQFFV